MAGCVLLHEARAGDPAGKPFHGEGAIRDEGKHAPCDGAVVRDNLTLGDAVSWEEDAVAAGDLYRPESKKLLGMFVLVVLGIAAVGVVATVGSCDGFYKEIEEVNVEDVAVVTR